MKDKPELDIFSLLLLGGVGYMFYRLYSTKDAPVIKQAPTPISVPIPNPAPLPISSSHITPIESPITSKQPPEISKPVMPTYIFGARQDATQPFDIYFNYVDDWDVPATKAGRDYLIGISNPFTLTVFKGPSLTMRAKDTINDTSLIERANPVVSARLDSIVSNYLLGKS